MFNSKFSSTCTICPFNCNVDRVENFGICKLPKKILVSRVQQHFFEEPMISGEDLKDGLGGSGAIFFTGCNGRCVFCQNYKISDPLFWGKKINLETSEEKFLEICLNLINEKKVHNINFVSPTPYSNLLCKFLNKYKSQIKVPIIWNSNGYEKVETLKKLDGLVDVYLPDFKYFDNQIALQYSKFINYFQFASEAVKEMYKQVGWLKLNQNNFITNGLIIRHLVLPGHTEDSKKILDWIKKEFGEKAYIALMAQYYPTYKAANFPEINRKLSKKEYAEISDYFADLDFADGLIQDLESADPMYTPEF
ncbi:MAG: hypothetical protein UR28_C0016G0014 [Candidatus Peregrinibacteria bacterium GW2011_GWF2_33_10]|nr:MAG: hypothetical protein UR28_C0016G0014 [Candidatus Peregrinibacteria bacterium GW2011_GWF2_33_10]OGJ45838.1 MAG: hypothetical protein A2263_03540 [Candidatus Peregrinibacteria bacterium RIFOXYA2_FULL_33_21]OGJ46494.1 MAG: hypothetical protein A2272_03580 [Candidatus Peregrinibacteria bacterium RIFOXYA12_FULL_33_12]OGJ51371.1 MAG: hypothetical protein A2307_02360 [Candidatus Peregrinibacteria bacterium RIFOXYB2_FULL_33_20]